ncbi:GNAT family N-acetyltransferase [Paraglaciecola sp. L3A3]|uniref:GNAT family N-acetyltransferase n=1 Tax=Paraglaciecola sp. L3A3 TaxID=2686358 RepID=UPI00131A85E1|nr:GNAT family N-acetyltransferase [Paraglaciecola sp. L3A3]
MRIRRATEQDADELAKLVFDSAPQLLTAAFNLTPEFSVKHFLVKNLSNRDGQYGYYNHWLVEQNNKVIACVSAWHTELSDEFHRATLSGITDFYGLQNALSLLHRNQALQDCMPQLKVNEWCIGHLSVSKSKQRQGVASALLAYMQQLALENNKSVLCLDVEASNTQAISFYTSLGFLIVSETVVTARMANWGLGSHLHLSKVLN